MNIREKQELKIAGEKWRELEALLESLSKEIESLREDVAVLRGMLLRRGQRESK